jgi:uncharacterized membrane-anchored protein
MTDRIRERIATLEQQLREQTTRREQAHVMLNEATTAILQVQGALAVLQELLTNPDAEPMA